MLLIDHNFVVFVFLKLTLNSLNSILFVLKWKGQSQEVELIVQGWCNDYDNCRDAWRKALSA